MGDQYINQVNILVNSGGETVTDNNALAVATEIGSTPCGAYTTTSHAALVYQSEADVLSLPCAESNVAEICVKDCALPVKLGYFKGALNDAKQAELEWQTFEEQDNDGFEIERSYNGQQFEKIGFEKSYAGNSVQENSYRFTDTTPIQTIAYYRLRQLDLSGAYTYSNMISIVANEEQQTQVAVYPNPAIDHFSIDLKGGFSESTHITLVDLSGRVLKTMALPANGQGNVDISSLTAGIYLVKIKDSKGNMQVKRLVKQ